jgi:hypothetical protein
MHQIDLMQLHHGLPIGVGSIRWDLAFNNVFAEKTSVLTLFPLHLWLLELLLFFPHTSCLFLHHRVLFVVLFVVVLAQIVDHCSCHGGKRSLWLLEEKTGTTVCFVVWADCGDARGWRQKGRKLFLGKIDADYYLEAI